MTRIVVRTGLLALAPACLLLSSCGKDEGKKDKAPPTVGFVVVQPTSVPVDTELAGRVSALQMSEVRPQVAGIVRRRFFKEGSLVTKGQTLYEIDPRVYSAAVDEAVANRNSAMASADSARELADRYKPLADMEAVARQDYVNAAAQARQTRAAVAQAQARLRSAQVSLQFTRVPAPISGRIGRSLFTEGALVTANQAEPLAVIQRMDPVFVDIQQSSAELLRLRRALADGSTPGDASVRLKLEDGSDYELPGKIAFSEVIVDPTTGTVTLRASFPNPDGVLLPGMFVRARFVQQVNSRAFLIPQQALRRDPRGAASVYVVEGDKAVERKVVVPSAQGTSWVVTSGLKPGDRLIIQGLGNIRPDIAVKPVPASEPQKVAPKKTKKGA
ncbi:efflux RND transporter periplasmic adaptor subunit [Novosphingobium sp. 11B]|jgi:membrane fusion protein (multidrug efflux system)